LVGENFERSLAILRIVICLRPPHRWKTFYGQCSAVLLKLQFKSIAPAQGFVNRNFEAQWKVCQRWIAMKTKTCPDCNGDGVVDKGTDDEHQCPMCGGSGVVPDDDDDEEVIRTSRA
jgi:RNA polymerase subunit RPABC4/transcription elongation factor Spt4